MKKDYILERINKENQLEEFAIISPDTMELGWITDFNICDRFNSVELIYYFTESRCNDKNYNYVIIDESDGSEIGYKN